MPCKVLVVQITTFILSVEELGFSLEFLIFYWGSRDSPGQAW
jgi:hypothetical protein